MKTTCFLIALCALGIIPDALAQKTPPKAATIPCRDTISDAVASEPNFDQVSMEKLLAIKTGLTDCVLTERRLSREDLQTAFKVRDALEIATWKRVAGFVSQDQKQYDDLKSHGKEVAEMLGKVMKQNQDVIEKYNGLVAKYNSLLDAYKENIDDNVHVRQLLDEQASECSDAIRSAIRSTPVQVTPLYRPMQPTHCTAQTMPNPIPGSVSWTYMNCN